MKKNTYIYFASAGILQSGAEGVPTILDNSIKLSGREPKYRLIDNDELLLTIYAHNP